MIISAKYIKKTRTLKRCENCNKKIQIRESALRLYGMGGDHDPPYVIYVHPKEPCMGCGKLDPKILRALGKSSEQPEGEGGR